MCADEFFAWIVHQDCRHELVDGAPVMVAGADRRHDRIVVNAAIQISAWNAGSRRIDQ
jgi:hypothetical protein